MRRVFACVVVLCVAAVLPVAAQEEPGPISWIAFDKSMPGKSRDLISMTIKDDGPMYDGLMKDGTLMSWGIAIPINHRLGDTWNYVLWANMADWSKVGELQAGFEKMFASRTPEEMAAMAEAYKEATVPGAHHDWVVRYQVMKQSDGDVMPRYISVSYYSAKPGQDLTPFYKKNVAPIYDKLLADGTITGYGMYTQELHGEPGWTHLGWYTMTDLGAIDAVDQAFRASFTEDMMNEAIEVMDWSTHKDKVLLIVHLGGMAEN
jgi:hypothetical protein